MRGLGVRCGFDGLNDILDQPYRAASGSSSKPLSIRVAGHAGFAAQAPLDVLQKTAATRYAHLASLSLQREKMPSGGAVSLTASMPFKVLVDALPAGTQDADQELTFAVDTSGTSGYPGAAVFGHLVPLPP